MSANYKDMALRYDGFSTDAERRRAARRAALRAAQSAHQASLWVVGAFEDSLDSVAMAHRTMAIRARPPRHAKVIDLREPSAVP